MMLPYLEVHCSELGPASPVRFMPRGNSQRLVPTSFFQSIERAVITCSPEPRYTRRVQACAIGASTTAATDAAEIRATNERPDLIIAVSSASDAAAPFMGDNYSTRASEAEALLGAQRCQHV